MKYQGRYEIRLSGFGGQGIILMGKILGTAAAIHHHRNATMIQTYGPETRGSACRVDLLLADETIDYPYLTRPQLLIVLSQDAYSKFRSTLGPGGLLLYDQDLVKLDEKDTLAAARQAEGTPAPGQLIYGMVPAMRLAEQSGSRIMTNIAMLGFCVALTEVIDLKALEAVVTQMVPASMMAANRQAVQRGHEFGLAWLAGQGGENATGPLAAMAGEQA